MRSLRWNAPTRVCQHQYYWALIAAYDQIYIAEVANLKMLEILEVDNFY